MPLFALPEFLFRLFAFSELKLKPLVGLLEALACHADFLEGARVGDGSADVISENMAPWPEFLFIEGVTSFDE
jgi:hypothetical protein